MFWQKKQTIEWVLVFYGLIALGIVVSTVILIIIFNNKVRQNGFLPWSTDQIQITVSSHQQLVLNYQQEMKDLDSWLAVEENSDTEKIFSKLENVFLSVRVPLEIRDNHLQTFLAIEKLSRHEDWIPLAAGKEEISKENVQQVKKEIKELLDKLLNSL